MRSLFQFDHDQVRVFVDSEKINSSVAVFPLAELFGHDQHVGCDHLDLRLQHILQIVSFPHTVRLEGRAFNRSLAGRSCKYLP